MNRSHRACLMLLVAVAGLFPTCGRAAEPAAADLERQFAATVRPFVQTYCQSCHNSEMPEAELDLSRYTTPAAVARGHQTWEEVLTRLEAGEMPPQDAPKQPTVAERKLVSEWIRAFRWFEAQRNAGDPGPVLVRRLSNAEYNYTIRDLTGVDIRPAREFPVDPANEAGFDNSGESLTMSPALLQKYVEAARLVAEHLVLTSDGFAFAPHPAVTDTDRDKYCVKRIVEFYRRQPTDLADYFHAAWRYRHRAMLGQPSATLADIATDQRVSPRYLDRVWDLLNDGTDAVGPLARLQSLWQELPTPGENNAAAVRGGCEQMRDDVVQLRQRLEFKFPDLQAAGIHKGSQTFVLWKNRQYASHRRRFNRDAVHVPSGADDERSAELAVPADPVERARHEVAFARFCDVFPDAFYIAERGRDYLGKSRDEQEKGRLLSAGFHSMMGYFRDDGPLYDLIRPVVAGAGFYHQRPLPAVCRFPVVRADGLPVSP
jgi:hypothetical protein